MKDENSKPEEPYSPIDDKEKVDGIYAQVCKELKIPVAVAAWIAAIELKTTRQRAMMAVWLYDSRETDVYKLLAKAREIAGTAGTNGESSGKETTQLRKPLPRPLSKAQGARAGAARGAVKKAHTTSASKKGASRITGRRPPAEKP